MKYIMLTGTSFEKVMEMNAFVFFALLEASDAVIAEESIRQIKIIDNHLLLKSKHNKSDYPNLLKHYKQTLKNKGINVWHKKADFAGIAQLKAMLKKPKK